MRLLLEILFFIITVGILPVVINKSTEVHLDWVRRYLRQLWSGIFAFFLVSWLATKPEIAGGVTTMHKQLHGWLGYGIAGLLGACIFCGFWWFTGRVVPSLDSDRSFPPKEPTKEEPQGESPTTEPNRRSPVSEAPPTQDSLGVKVQRAPRQSVSATVARATAGPASERKAEKEPKEKPPTLLDLFKSDFPNTTKASDTNADAYGITSDDGVTVKVKRQMYMDFDAKVKFIGFYISMPTPPTGDFSGQKTAAACMELLRHDAVQDTFDHFGNQVAVMAGRGDQMTSLKDLTFSGRVLIYHEEFLSIPQKSEILTAYKAKRMDVIFRGMDYLGSQMTAWYQQHGTGRR
jgi:hypothetical protein